VKHVLALLLLQGNLCGQNPPLMHASATGHKQMEAARAATNAAASSIRPHSF
jgi:hypothetical protein